MTASPFPTGPYRAAPYLTQTAKPNRTKPSRTTTATTHIAGPGHAQPYLDRFASTEVRECFAMHLEPRPFNLDHKEQGPRSN